MNEKKKKFGFSELWKILSIAWILILATILAFVYVNSFFLPVWKEVAIPWLTGGVIITLLGIIAVQIDKKR